QGPAIPVHIVLQVEDFWKAGAGDFVFGPGAIRVLGAGKVIDAAADAGTIGIVEGAEAHDRPRCLGGGAVTLAFKNRIVVGIAALTPTAIVVLDAFEPVAAFDQPGLGHVEVHSPHSAQDLPGAVDVINAPTPIPGAIAFLLVADVPESLLNLRMIEAITLVAQQFKNTRGDVGAFGVEHGVVIREGDLFQDALGAILVKGGPAAVAA